MYNKLFTKILDSSIWLQSTPTRIVWLTFIAVMDESGFAQFASVANVAHRARVTIEEAQEAITAFEGPDPDSSDPTNHGQRLERVPGGWMVLNSEKHRAMVTRALIQEQTRERVRRHRERKRNSNASVTTSEAEARSEADAEVPPIAPQGGRARRKRRGYHAEGRTCQHVPGCKSFKACTERTLREAKATA